MIDGWPPRLTVDIEPVLRLFTGEHFYSSADAALREAVLNAIDAIGRRQLLTAWADGVGSNWVGFGGATIVTGMVSGTGNESQLTPVP